MKKKRKQHRHKFNLPWNHWSNQNQKDKICKCGKMEAMKKKQKQKKNIVSSITCNGIGDYTIFFKCREKLTPEKIEKIAEKFALDHHPDCKHELWACDMYQEVLSVLNQVRSEALAEKCTHGKLKEKHQHIYDHCLGEICDPMDATPCKEPVCKCGKRKP